MSTEPGPAERIAKRIARAGVCSRREAERLIEAGRVAVDGEVLSSPAVTVGPASRVTVDGEPLPEAGRARLFRYHKPPGVLTAARDPRGRPTITDRLPADLPRLMPIGRLDFTSEGLLLLTNDGALKRRLELPATGWLRRYRVRVHGRVDEARLKALEDGITVPGPEPGTSLRFGPIQARLDRVQGSNAWLTMALREGRNREVRRVLEQLELVVNRLIRVSYGPFHLGALQPDAVAEVSGKVLREQLGDRAPDAPARRRPGVRAPGPASPDSERS